MLPVPQQIFTHALDFLKGWYHQHALDYVGKLDPATDPTAQPVNGGRVVHVSSATPVANGQGRVDSLLQLGATGTQMAIFTIQSQISYDVSNFGNGNVDPYGWTPVAPAGWQSGLVASGAFELATTEFDQTAGVVYLPNDVLHAPTAAQITTGTNFASAGLLFKYRNWPGGDAGQITAGTDSFCAVVSRGQYANHNRQQVIAFWPVYGWGPAGH
jgi:hypothetical protein